MPHPVLDSLGAHIVQSASNSVTVSKPLTFLGMCAKGREGDCVDPLFERFGITWKNQKSFSKSKVLPNLGTYNEFRRFRYLSTGYFQTGSFDPSLMIYPNLT